MALSTLEDRLSLLMAMPTVIGNTAVFHEVIAAIAEELESLGLFVHVYDDTDHSSLVATTQATTKQPRLMLAAHLDIVPPAAGVGHELIIDGSRLKGRGVWDMKFAAACYLELLRTLADEGSLSSYDIGLMLTTDEERGGFQTDRLLGQEGWRPELTILPDGGQDWAVESSAKGSLHVRLSVAGRSAHGSRPWEGDSAFEHLLDAIAFIRTTYPYRGPDDLTVTLTTLNGGVAVNQVPDAAEAVLDIRSHLLGELEELRDGLAGSLAPFGVQVVTEVFGYPTHFEAEHGLSQAFLRCLSIFTGDQAVRYVTSYGGSDARWFSQYGLATVVIRPRGGGIHGPDEWLQREDLSRFAALIEQFVRAEGREMSFDDLVKTKKHNEKPSASVEYVEKLLDTV